MLTTQSLWQKLPTLLAKHAALDSAASPILWVDQQGLIGYANRSISRVLGYTLEDLIEKPINILASSMQQNHWQTTWWPKLSLEKVIEAFPLTWQHKKGIHIAYGASVSLIEVAQLEFASFNLWPLSENSQHTHDKEDLLTELNKLLQDLKEGVCLLDPIGRIEYVNHAMSTMLGLHEQALIGNYLLEIITPIDINTGDLWDILHQQTDEIEFQFENLAKQILDVRMTVTSQRENHTVLRYVVSFIDITEQRKVSKELEEQNASFERLASNVPGFIYKFRMTPEGKTSFPYATKGCKDVFGVDPEDVKNDATPIMQSIHPEDVLDFQATVMESGKSLLPWNHEARMKTKEDKDWRWFHGASRPELQSNGDIIWEGLVMDVTNRKQVEIELAVAKEAAEASARAKAEFVANMSHEIRTPLNAIMGMGRLLSQTKLTEEQKDYLKKLQMSSENLLSIINDVLDFSKIEAEKLLLEQIDFHLDSVFEQLGNMLEPKAAEKGLELLIYAEPDVPLDLVGDPVRLGQILINLCSNAVKFTAQGEVVIAVTLEEMYEQHVKLKFKVKDTGIGIPEEKIKYLFQPFTQVDNSTTRKFGGTGLGLAICKRLVELMQGEIWVQSTIHQGSEFGFTAIFGRATAHGYTKPILANDLKSLKVLVVDDNETARLIFNETLSSMGFEVIVVDSGKSAIEKLQQAIENNDYYDLILLDWDMPGMDGIDTAKAIEKLEINKLPVVMMISAYGSNKVRELAGESMIAGFLSKPINQSSLFDSLVNAMHEKDPSSKQKIQAKQKNYQLQGLKVLVAEDNEINQEVAKKTLETAGILVSVAANGKEAIAQLQEKLLENPFDIVLMDIQMPELDGIEATTKIRTMPEFNHLPIIAMTAHAFVSEKERCLASGMQDHISKPIDPDKLFTVLKQWSPNKPENTLIEEEKELILQEEPPALENLPVLNTVNLPMALKLLNQDKKLLFSLLHKFANEHANAAPVMQELLTAGKIQELIHRAHLLKGVAGNLQIQAVYQHAAELENNLRNDNLTDIQTHLNNLILAIEAFVLEMQTLPIEHMQEKPIDTNSNIIQDVSLALELTTKLIELLKTDDLEAGELLTELSSCLIGKPLEKVHEIQEYVTTLDFQPATIIAQQLQEELQNLSSSTL